MSKYDEVFNDIEKKVYDAEGEKRKTIASSRQDLDNMASALINTPEHEVTTFSTNSFDENGDPEKITSQPVKRYRNSLKGMVKNLGIDKYDADKLDDMQFSREHASAIVDLSTTLIHDYMKAGRKLSLPITSKDECKIEMYMDEAPERITTGGQFGKETNKQTLTKKRKVGKIKNSVPSWLKKSK